MSISSKNNKEGKNQFQRMQSQKRKELPQLQAIYEGSEDSKVSNYSDSDGADMNNDDDSKNQNAQMKMNLATRRISREYIAIQHQFSKQTTLHGSIHSNIKMREEQSKTSNDSKFHSASEAFEKELDAINMDSLNNICQNEVNFTFSELKQKFKNNTNIEVPFNMTQVSDVMYLKDNVIISLEYNFFSSKIASQLLKEDQENTVLGAYQYNLEYQKQLDNKKNILGHFNSRIQNFVDSELKYEEQDTGNGDLMEAQLQGPSWHDMIRPTLSMETPTSKQKIMVKNSHHEYALAEASLCLWKVSKDSKLQPQQEKIFSTNLPFIDTKNGTMQMKVTRDQQTISLLYFNKNINNYKSKRDFNYDSERYFKVMSWNITSKNTFEDMKHYPELDNELQSFYMQKVSQGCFKRIDDYNFFSGAKYFIITYVIKQDSESFDILDLRIPSPSIPIKKEVLKVAIFDALKGELIIDFDKKQHIKFQNEQGSQQQCCCLDLLMKDTVVPHDPNSLDYQFSQMENQLDIIAKSFKDNGSEQTYPIVINEVSEPTKYSDEIVIFFANEVRDDIQNNKQIKHLNYYWNLDFVSISLSELLKIQEMKERIEMINDKIKSKYKSIKYIPNDSQTMNQNETKYHYDICNNMTITANNTFEQIAVIIDPKYLDENNKKKYLLYRLDYKYDILVKILEYSFKKDQTIMQCRNSHIKKENYFIIQHKIDGNQVKCIAIDEQSKLHKNTIKLTQQDNCLLNYQDAWCYPSDEQAIAQDIAVEDDDGEDEEDCKELTMQVISIKKGDQKIFLKTKVPLQHVSRKAQNYENISINSIRYQQIYSQYPVVAYNIGMHKIAFVNLLKRDQPKQLILQLDEDEHFLTFVDFKSYQSIGFIPLFLKIESCSSLLFLTVKENLVKMNLFLIDPYFYNEKVMMIKSSHVIDYADFDEEDMIQKAIICPSGKYEDNDLKIYIITQYEALINRSMLISSLNLKDELVSNNDDRHSFFDAESDDDSKPSTENVVMFQDNENFIYYVVKNSGVCSIMEINPNESQLINHASIMDIKAEKCMGFSMHNEMFFFIDEFKTIHMLKRKHNSRQLKQVEILTIKENSRDDFKFQDFKSCILTEKYMIYGSKIFYLDKEYCQNDKIMQTEDLLNEDQQHTVQKTIINRGPIKINGSEQFLCTYQIGKFKSMMKIYCLPDAQYTTLMNNFHETIDFSTFLENGKILIKNKDRFFVFTNSGLFIGQVSFEDEDMEVEEDGITTLLNDRVSKEMTFSNSKRENMFKKFSSLSISVFTNSEDQCVERKETMKLGKEFLSKSSKMELVQISNKNQFYLFFDRIAKKFRVFKLVETPIPLNINVQFERQSIPSYIQRKLQIDNKYTYTFQLVYELNFHESNIYKEVLKKDIDDKKELDSKIMDLINVRLENKGDVCMSYTILDQEDPKQENAYLFISLFKANQKTNNQMIKFTLPKTAIANLKRMQHDCKIYLKELQNKERIIQQKLPENLKNDRLYKLVGDRIKHMAHHKQKIVFHKIFGNVIIAWCANYVSHATFQKDKEGNLNISKFQKIGIQLSPDAEITGVLNTQYPKIFQIIAYDYALQIKIIVAWDIELEMEVSCLQRKTYGKRLQKPRVFKGMNENINYYRGEYYIIDLQYNLPFLLASGKEGDDELQISNINIDNMLDKIDNQKKIFQNNTKYLGIQQPATLNYGLSRMDYVFWESVDSIISQNQNQKVSVHQFAKWVTLENFAKFFNGQSLFHYYVENKDSDFINIIRNKFIKQQNEDVISTKIMYLPLMSLQPDQKNYTALQHCIENENLRSFEDIIEILSDLREFTVTNIIIKFIPFMLNRESTKFENFFNKVQFKPLSMQQTWVVPWESDKEEFLFSSNTSLIQKDYLIQNLKHKGIIPSDQEISINEDQDSSNEQEIDSNQIIRDTEKLCECANEQNRMRILQRLSELEIVSNDCKCKMPKLNKPEQAIIDPDQSDFYKLKGQDYQNSQRNTTRIQIEGIEFEWIFQNDNAKNFIKILAGLENTNILKAKSIDQFITFMWRNHYKREIRLKILIPYQIYMGCIHYLATYVLSEQYSHEIIKEIKEQEPAFNYISGFMISITGCLFVFFTSIEISQMLELKLDYFKDPWNIYDLINIILNFMLLFIVSALSITEESSLLFAVHHKLNRVCAAFSCFFMWIKVFYWMRLFNASAMYVRLIMDTFVESTHFLYLVFMIMIAFSSFYFVMNQDYEWGFQTVEGFDYADDYVPTFTGITLLDVGMQFYMTGLGELQFDNLLEEDGIRTNYAPWLMFILATFVICVIFMNMLIAIMGQTFDKVTSQQKESRLKEYACLMNDHLWLLDLNQIFRNKKYLIRVSQVKSSVWEMENEDKLESMDSHEGIKNQIKCLQNVVEQRASNQDMAYNNLHKMAQKSKSKLNKSIKLQQEQEQLLQQMKKESDVNDKIDEIAQKIQDLAGRLYTQ